MTVEGHQHRPHNSALSNKHNGDSQDNKEAALLIDDDYSRSSDTTSVSANGHILGNSNTAAVVVANDNDGGHTEGAEAPWFRGMSAEKRWTLCLTAFGNFAACTCFSLIAPFFPNEVSSHSCDALSAHLLTYLPFITVHFSSHLSLPTIL